MMMRGYIRGVDFRVCGPEIPFLTAENKILEGKIDGTHREDHLNLSTFTLRGKETEKNHHAMAQPKVLFVLTSADKMPTGESTGWWLVCFSPSSSPLLPSISLPKSTFNLSQLTPYKSEFAHPYTILAPHANITIASPKGGPAPLDSNSVAHAKSTNDSVSATFLSTQSSLWETTVPLSTITGHAGEYAAIFFVGGHGPMVDLANDPESIALIREFYSADKVIAAVCHGPAALINVRLDDGRHLLEGLNVTGFTDSEEANTGVKVPFSLQQRLDQASGGGFVRGEDWKEMVEVGRHGKLITGQNPGSAAAVGGAILEAIKA